MKQGCGQQRKQKTRSIVSENGRSTGQIEVRTRARYDPGNLQMLQAKELNWRRAAALKIIAHMEKAPTPIPNQGLVRRSRQTRASRRREALPNAGRSVKDGRRHRH